MSELFTVRWPWLARFEAALLGPVMVMLANDIPAVRRATDAGLLRPIPFLEHGLGLSDRAVFHGAVMIVTAGVWFAALPAIDRLLVVRKGFAILSGLAIVVWTGAAAVLSHRLTPVPPIDLTNAAASTAAVMALLVHLPPLWIGLRDRGLAGQRLRRQSQWARARAEALRGSAVEGGGRLVQNPRGRLENLRALAQSSWVDIRGWSLLCLALTVINFGRHDIIGLFERSARGYTALTATPPGPSLSNIAAGDPPMEVRVEPRQAMSAAPDISSPIIQNQPLGQNPPVGSPLPLDRTPFAASHTPVMITPDSRSDDDEAVAHRGRNGHFVFDAEVDGFDISLMFDTGASLVTLREEDAASVGINVRTLNYSVRVRTANGLSEAAPVVIGVMKVGGIIRRNVPALVARRGKLPVNLLGQSFLGRVAGYNMDGDQLVLRGDR
jgi:clan AA aspartic protease (TIGR02281 family)